MKSKDLVWFGVGLLGSLLLISIGIAGIRAEPSSVSTPGALIFTIGGLYLFFRIGYRLIKKLGLKNR